MTALVPVAALYRGGHAESHHFAAAAVAGDRRGIADSIRGRLRRHGGTATLVTAPGDGTEWELVVPLDGQDDDSKEPT